MELAEQLNNQELFLTYGLVKERRDRELMVLTRTGLHMAEKAVSCLILPEPGDVVLLSLDDDGRGYVLSVLKRNQEAFKKNKITLDGSTDLHVQGGDLSITSDSNINLASENGISCSTDSIDVHAKHGRAVLERITVLGKVLINQMEKITSVAHTVEQVYKRLTQRLVNGYRLVEEHDEVQARTSRRLVEDLMTVQTKNTCHLAQETIKIDAEHINLG